MEKIVVLASPEWQNTIAHKEGHDSYYWQQIKQCQLNQWAICHKIPDVHHIFLFISAMLASTL